MSLSYDTDLMRFSLAPSLGSSARAISEAAVLIKSAANLCPSGFAAGSALPGLATQTSSLAENILDLKTAIINKADSLENAENNNSDLAALLPLMFYNSLDDNSLAKFMMKENDKKYLEFFYNSDKYKEQCHAVCDSLADSLGVSSDEVYNAVDGYIKGSGSLSVALARLLGLSSVASASNETDDIKATNLNNTNDSTKVLMSDYMNYIIPFLSNIIDGHWEYNTYYNGNKATFASYFTEPSGHRIVCTSGQGIVLWALGICTSDDVLLATDGTTTGGFNPHLPNNMDKTCDHILGLEKIILDDPYAKVDPNDPNSPTKLEYITNNSNVAGLAIFCDQVVNDGALSHGYIAFGFTDTEHKKFNITGSPR